VGTDVLTGASIARHLSELGRQLDVTVEMLRDADLDAVHKRSAADTSESLAFVEADGSMDLRKHTARLAASSKEHDALVAEALVRHMRTKVRALETRIDVGRSMGAALRAELNTLPGVPG
jgi:hypothetical protein